MRIVITGGAGFIGSHLCKAFIEKKENVICVDNLITGKIENIEEFLNNKRFTFLHHDISKPITIKGSVDYVFHFASPASPVDYFKYPIQTLKAGSLGTHNTLGLAKAKGAKFLLASSSEVYGDPQVIPQTEEYFGNVNLVSIRGVYDESKRFAEAITLAYHREHNLDTRIVRIFNTYGPKMRKDDGRVIPNFIIQALKGEPITIYGDGKQTRSFCYISDLIRGIEAIVESDYHLPINLGSDNEKEIIELAHIIKELTNSKSKFEFLPLPENDPKRRCPDLTKIKKISNWNPTVSLEEGLKETISYFRKRIL